MLYYIWDTIYARYRLRRMKSLERIHRQTVRKDQKAKKWKTSTKGKKHKQEIRIGHKDWEKIRNIIQRAEVNISRGYLESARLLVVEWLALKKDDKDLNITLADIYEQEKKYQNAEYVYKDMLEIYEDDETLLRRLGYTLAVQWKNKESFEMYEKAFEKNPKNIEVLDTLAHLWLELQKHKKALKYANLFLRERPRDSEKLWIKGYCLEMLWEGQEAIAAYYKLLEVQPYNSEVQDRITQLSS